MPKKTNKAEYAELKRKALAAMQEPGYSITALARRLGVTEKTLRAWRHEYENTANLTPMEALVRTETNMSMEQMRLNYARKSIERIDSLTTSLIRRAEELARTEPDLARVAVAIRAVSELRKTLLCDPVSEQGQSSPVQMVNLFQQTIYQLNQEGNNRGIEKK